MKESTLERRLVDGVKRAGGIAWKFTSPANAGVPDRLITMPGGRVIFVELKTETGTLAPIQRVQQNKLKLLGHDVRTLYGKQEVEDFIDELQTMGIPGCGREVDPLAPEVRALSLNGPGEDSNHADGDQGAD